MYKPIWFKGETRRALERHYRRVLPVLRATARASGYALGLHGSLCRDLDLIAVPWRRGAVKSATLVTRLCRAACGMRHSAYQWGWKPHGRRAVLIPIGMRAIIDLSVVPLAVDPYPKKRADRNWAGVRDRKEVDK